MSYHNLKFIRIWPEKPLFFEGWPWFIFNNLGLALGTNLKFYTSVAKGLRIKVGKCWGLIRTFVEVTGEKMVRGVGETFCPPSWIGWKALWTFTKNVLQNHILFQWLILLLYKKILQLVKKKQLAKSNAFVEKDIL